MLGDLVEIVPRGGNDSDDEDIPTVDVVLVDEEEEEEEGDDDDDDDRSIDESPRMRMRMTSECHVCLYYYQIEAVCSVRMFSTSVQGGY